MRPNFIIFLTDDQGYADLSCMGQTDFKTPNIDRLAHSGARFTSWYANSALCSPTRASLMTGRYPGNAGVRGVLRGARNTPGLAADTPTIAEALKPLGYRTGIFGKWHLGLDQGCRPHERGFDSSLCFLAGCIDYYSHIFYWGSNYSLNPIHDLWEDGEEVWRDGEYFTDLIVERAVQFVRDAARDGEPFLLYVPFNAPHYPMHAPKKYVDRFAHLPWDRRIMAAMLSAVDDGVGAIMDELERHGLVDDTCIFYMSDNGPSRESRNWLDGTPDPYYGGSAGKLKGHKSSLYDGGIRVPGIVSWPARVPAGQVIDEPVAGMDVFPTIMAAAGADVGEIELDGKSLLPVLIDGAPSPHEAIYWELRDQLAVRKGRWKLVLNGELIKDGPTRETDVPVHLADIESDMAESENLADRFPDVVKELTEMAQSWLAGIEERFQSLERARQ